MKNFSLMLFVSGLILLSNISHLKAATFDHQHQNWSKILKAHVQTRESRSAVNYAAIKASPAVFDIVLKEYSGVTKAQYDSFSKPQKLAFLINSYNAFTVKLVLDHYPVESIKKIGSLFTSAWKIKFFTFLGEKTYLDHLEHDLIRNGGSLKDFNEPRIHFALVCASKSCPGLLNEAYQADTLEQQLELVSTRFLKDKKRNHYDASKKTLSLSKIYQWYGSDFEKKFGSVKAFVAPRIAPNAKLKKKILSQKTNITYDDYDWSLNNGF